MPGCVERDFRCVFGRPCRPAANSPTPEKGSARVRWVEKRHQRCDFRAEDLYPRWRFLFRQTLNFNFSLISPLVIKYSMALCLAWQKQTPPSIDHHYRKIAVYLPAEKELCQLRTWLILGLIWPTCSKLVSTKRNSRISFNVPCSRRRSRMETPSNGNFADSNITELHPASAGEERVRNFTKITDHRSS